MDGTRHGMKRPAGLVASLVPLVLVLLVLVAGAAGRARADEIRYLRIGTGPAGESHFPMGGLIASAISGPPGARPCDRGGNCGVPGLIAVANSTAGSTSNAEALGAHQLDAAMIQADVAMWAYQGAPPFEGKPIKSLRTIANLYPDLLHVVARREANIHSLADLRGKRVSLGEKGSGTLIHARQALAIAGIKESDIHPEYVRSGLAADAMMAGKLDAFFVLDGIPVPSVAELAKSRPITLVPLEGEPVLRWRKADPLLQLAIIPAGTYQGVDTDTATLGVGVSLVVTADLSDELAYALSKALWNPVTTRMLAESQPQGANILLPNALTRIGAPLHPGALQFYHDNGLTE